MIEYKNMNPEIPRFLKKDVISTPDDKRKALQELGFKEEKTLEYLGVHFRIDTLKEKIEKLKKAGFENPIPLIEKYPRLASYDIQKVKKDLEEAGFKNPIGAIEKYPPLADLDIQRVERRIRTLERLIEFHSLKGISGIEWGESQPDLFGYNIHRIYFYWKILRKISPEISYPEELIKKVNLLRVQNPYLVFSYLKERKPQDFPELKGIFSTIRGLSKYEKAGIIRKTKETLPKTIEELKESPQPYDKFLLKLTQSLELIEKTKGRKKEREEQ